MLSLASNPNFLKTAQRQWAPIREWAPIIEWALSEQGASVTLELERLRLEEHEFKAALSYKKRLHLQRKKKW